MAAQRTIKPEQHGSLTGYTYGCRCGPCKTVQAAYAEAYREKYPDRVRTTAAAYYKRNRDKTLARQRARHEADPARKRARDRAWYKANREITAANEEVKRARKANATILPIDFDALARELCGICGEPLDFTLRHPDLRAPSRDHIVPLAPPYSGAHSQANLQWAHMHCNNRKHNRLESELSPETLAEYSWEIRTLNEENR